MIKDKNNLDIKKGQRIKLCNLKYEEEKSGPWKYDGFPAWFSAPDATFEVEYVQKQPDGRIRLVLTRPQQGRQPIPPKDFHDLDCAIFIRP